ncbi:MAG TPA: hypothetical protein IAA26_13165 [Candidatus Blautia faecipullorum]|nr:hypothetical protein [Candidatus Blautia faecipullorum]
MKNEIQAAVIGAGMIGLSMCALLTGNGIKTKLYVRRDPLKRKEQYKGVMDDLAEQKLLPSDAGSKCSSYLKVVTSYEELQNVEVVFECASEELGIKQKIYSDLLEHCPFLKVIASTTSAIPSEELAKGTCSPEKIVVAHPFYPPHLIPCVEVIPNRYTSDGTLNSLMELLRYLGRKPVLLKRDARGFVANRLQYAMLREAVHIVEEGIARPEDVDEILMYSFAPRYTSIGIFEHFDNCGLDLTGKICKDLYPDLSRETEVQELVQKHCRSGEYGVKTEKGIYDWKEKNISEFRFRIREPYLKYFSWRLPEKECNWEETQ